jgi:hypothetical protein
MPGEPDHPGMGGAMRFPFFTLVCGAVFLALAQPASAADVLITEAEASLPSPVDATLTTRGLTRGPVVEQVTPDPDAEPVKSPLPLKIKFQTRNNVPIDKDSVKLTYVRTPGVDLTSRIKAHIGDDGIEIKQAEVPPGKHVIRIELKDQQGRSTTGTIKLTVVK